MTQPTKPLLPPPSTTLATTDSLAVVLVEPRIPQNVGNIARLCACAGVELFLVGDLGFRLGDKFYERAGMDYLERARIHHVQSPDTLWVQKPGHTCWYLTTHASNSYTQVTYTGPTLLVFGREDMGLPKWLLAENPEQCIRIPMVPGERSLNLSSAVAVVTYEAIRQRLMAVEGV